MPQLPYAVPLPSVFSCAEGAKFACMRTSTTAHSAHNASGFSTASGGHFVSRLARLKDI